MLKVAFILLLAILAELSGWNAGIAAANADPDNPIPECDCCDCVAGYWFSVDASTNELRGVVQVTPTEGGGCFVTWLYAPKQKGAAIAPDITHGVGKMKNCVLAVSWGSPTTGMAVSIYERTKKDGRVRVVGEGEIWTRMVPPTKTVEAEGGRGLIPLSSYAPIPVYEQ